MNRTTITIPTLTLLLALAAGAAAPAAAGDAWQLSISGVSAQSTAASGSGGSLGVGVSVEYRATPRIGVALAGLTGEVDGLDIEFFLPGGFATEIRMTPILARLDLHLTPGRKADLYLGPVAGHVSLSDVTVNSRGFESRIETEDQAAWGAHAGVDVRLGGGNSFLTAGLTWLDLPLELEFDFDGGGPTLESGTDLVPLPAGGDLDPLIVQVGWSYRF
jgi:outer membrane protein W